MKFSTVIWDWNGTLLDDLHLSVRIINQLLEKRSLPVLSTERYREVFTFPVKDYYRKIGFDFDTEPFEIPAREYIDIYNRDVSSCGLQSSATDVLQRLQSKDVRQLILSAMEQNPLVENVKQNNIFPFFEMIRGLDNHYAASKLDNGKQLLEDAAVSPKEVLLIGDTIHDFEVAEAIGCHCLLVANGHQSHERLAETGCELIDSLNEIPNYFS
jgi:phosphoglycolate phosphatase